MADKWQIWYPHKIDAWQGSATIQTFSDPAYRGYHNLIMAQFQSEDGMLPDDDRALAKESRLGPRWPDYAGEIRAALISDGNGRIYSPTQYALWQEAYKKHLEHVARMEAINQRRAERNKPRDDSRDDSRDDARAEDVTPPVTAAGTMPATTVTETVTETVRERKTKTCAEASSTPATDLDGNPLTLILNDGTEYAVPAEDCVRWSSSYPAVNILTELLKMREWCLSHPRERKTRRGIAAFITSWLGRTQDKGNRNYGENYGGGPVNVNRGQARSDANDEAARRAAATIVARHAQTTGGGAWS
jgi:hypothetical protein